MKKITVIAAAVLVLAACQSKQKSQNAAAEVADSCAVVVEEQVCELDSAAQEVADTVVAVLEEVAE
ncbi:MAG: lipoprotein [Bacteroidaceae bacterium]|nr:lipoprotein [Bacteroidaceae bacterium]